MHFDSDFSLFRIQTLSNLVLHMFMSGSEQFTFALCIALSVVALHLSWTARVSHQLVRLQSIGQSLHYKKSSKKSKKVLLVSGHF